MTGRPAGSSAAARARSAGAVQATGSGGGSRPSTAASCAILWPGRRRITARRRVGTIQAIVDPRMSTTRSHSVPTVAGPQRQPVQAVGQLVEHDGTLAVRHAREHALGDRAAGDGDAGVRVGADQVVQQPGGQHRIAEAVGRDEQDAHRVTGLAAGAGLCELMTAWWPLQGSHGEAHDPTSRHHMIPAPIMTRLAVPSVSNRPSFDAVRASGAPTLHPVLVEAGCRA